MLQQIRNPPCLATMPVILCGGHVRATVDGFVINSVCGLVGLLMSWESTCNCKNECR